VSEVPVIPVGIAGIGTYFPAQVETAAALVERTGIPEEVLREKMGIRQRHVAGPEDTVTYMASCAARDALTDAKVAPEQIRVVISHGSEYKDHLVWNAAAKIQHNVGATNAYAFEVYALCAGAPIAIQTARGLMLSDSGIEHALLAAASRENDLVNLRNQRVRFMYNFGAGGGAMVLKRGATRNLILGVSALTDGSLADAVLMSQEPDAVGDGAVSKGDLRGKLDVLQPDYMADRLNSTSLANFVRVIREAVEQGGQRLEDVRFLGLTHMKRSFYHEILSAVGLTPAQSVYLEDYGHIQSVDQVLALQLGLSQGKIRPGDLIVLAGAGVGYTWSAVAIRWG
jgi:3-oxoacyl-[acyl-carrier-protein] synthase-3